MCLRLFFASSQVDSKHIVAVWWKIHSSWRVIKSRERIRKCFASHWLTTITVAALNVVWFSIENKTTACLLLAVSFVHSGALYGPFRATIHIYRGIKKFASRYVGPIVLSWRLTRRGDRWRIPLAGSHRERVLFLTSNFCRHFWRSQLLSIRVVVHQLQIVISGTNSSYVA